MKDLVDSHFHLLAIEQKNINIKNLLEELDKKGFFGGIDIGLRIDDLPRRIELTSSYPQILHATGIGSWGVSSDINIDKLVSDFSSFIADYPFNFIGEIGLDYYWNYGTKEDQKELFITQIELANSLNKSVIIHNRDADDDTREIIETQNFSKRAIIHCFSATEELLKSALNKNFFISFAGPITYKKNDYLRQMLALVPLENLLLETDSPYLSPEPLRGKINTPLNISHIYKEAAQIKNISYEKVVEQLKINFKSLFN